MQGTKMLSIYTLCNACFFQTASKLCAAQISTCVKWMYNSFPPHNLVHMLVWVLVQMRMWMLTGVDEGEHVDVDAGMESDVDADMDKPDQNTYPHAWLMTIE